MHIAAHETPARRIAVIRQGKGIVAVQRDRVTIRTQFVHHPVGTVRRVTTLAAAVTTLGIRKVNRTTLAEVPVVVVDRLRQR